MINSYLIYHLILIQSEMNPLLKEVFLWLFFIGMFLVVFNRIWIFVEQQFAERFHRPFFMYPVLWRHRLNKSARRILEQQFSYYQQLKPAQQRRFRHRLARLIPQFEFHGREGLVVTEEMQVLVISTAVMLSFGFRNYSFPNLERIVLYPGPYHSELGEHLHQGEYSPAYKTLALSWPDFQRGYDIGNDNINLGIHEWSHILHIKCHFGEDISSQIYNDGVEALKEYLKNHENIRRELLETPYVRSYAFDNELEFIAVLIECYFETPKEFKAGFPEIFGLVRRMLGLKQMYYKYL